MFTSALLGVVSVTNNMKSAFHELSSAGTPSRNPLSESISSILTGTLCTMLAAALGLILTLTFLTLLILDHHKRRSYSNPLITEIEPSNENHRRPRNP